MAIPNLRSKRVYWISSGFMLLVAARVYSFNENIPSPDGSEPQPHLVEWKVTEFTGFVYYVVKGGSSYCESESYGSGKWAAIRK